MKYIFLLFVVVIVDVVVCSDEIVLIISFDGFRHDYLSKTATPHFDQLIADGATSPDGIEARFITKTFPNHHSIATGLYEESHGIMANSFFDPLLNDTFSPTTTDSKWWDTGAVPLWVTNQLAGGVSGGAMWPGTEASIRNQTPTHLLPFDRNLSWTERVDRVVGWMLDAQHPANCIFMYFEEPDSAGHSFGPDSPEVVEAIGRVDNITGYLVAQLKDKALFDRVNLIISSDHGMASTPKTKFIDLNAIIPPTSYRAFSSSPVWHILPNDPDTDHVYTALLNASKSHNFTVYRREEIPDEYHYKNNRRVMPILLVADEEWAIAPYTMEELGNHGYNNSLPSMRPFFVAHGPGIKSGLAAKPFRNIDIYPLACYLLGIQPMPNNASLDNVTQLLRNPPTTSIDRIVLIVVGILLGACLVGALVAIVIVYRKHKSERWAAERRMGADDGSPDEEESLIRPPNNDDA